MCTRLSTVPDASAKTRRVHYADLRSRDSTGTQFANNTIPVTRFDPIAAQVLARYPAPNLPGAATITRERALEPDSQDQFDTRLDRYFGAKHRVFGRYSYVRDDDTPVTPLPDGSGSIASGVISHTLTRGNQVVGDYEWTLSPTMLNQARFGYTRRSSNGSSLENGGIAVPGIPTSSFSSVLPTFNVTGFQQIGPPSGANSQFATSVTEYLDTFSIDSWAAHREVRDRYPARVA